MKSKIAKILDLFGLNYIFFRLSLIIYGNHIRVVNYHGTSKIELDNFEQQLLFYKKYYDNCSISNLRDFLLYGNSLSRSRIIISFDDGHRSNFENALPYLEKYGFTGWFMIPVKPVDANSLEQINFIGKAYQKDKNQFTDGRYMMDWNELAYLANYHVIGCHTYSHHRMSPKDKIENLQNEIIESKLVIEKKLNKKIDVFCWVGGEEITYTEEAAKMIKEAGYVFSFMTNTHPIKTNTSPLQIQRTNIETNYPLALVKFQLGPLMDFFYFFKRSRVNKLTANI